MTGDAARGVVRIYGFVNWSGPARRRPAGSDLVDLAPGESPLGRALRRFTVRAQLPGPLAPLEILATNLRWTWHQPTQDLFASLDERTWAAVNGDPVRLLGEIPTGRLTALAGDQTVVARTAALAEDLRRYLDEPRWYQQRLEALPTLPTSIAYFSMEFGVSEVLPFYSGGLGVLAGDHLKAASDLGVPLIGVGLLYGSGYFRQSLSLDGWQLEHYPVLDPQGLPLHLLVDAAGRLAGDGVKRRGDQFGGTRIFSDQGLGHPADRSRQARAAIAFVILRPSDEPVIGRDLQE